jgi:hypothetical protein
MTDDNAQRKAEVERLEKLALTKVTTLSARDWVDMHDERLQDYRTIFVRGQDVQTIQDGCTVRPAQSAEASLVKLLEQYDGTIVVDVKPAAFPAREEAYMPGDRAYLCGSLLVKRPDTQG